MLDQSSWRIQEGCPSSGGDRERLEEAEGPQGGHRGVLPWMRGWGGWGGVSRREQGQAGGAPPAQQRGPRVLQRGKAGKERGGGRDLFI